MIDQTSKNKINERRREDPSASILFRRKFSGDDEISDEEIDEEEEELEEDVDDIECGDDGDEESDSDLENSEDEAKA